jgi:hypothetical protein
MIHNFITTFSFDNEFPFVDQALHMVRQKVFEEAYGLPLDQEVNEWTPPLQKL